MIHSYTVKKRLPRGFKDWDVRTSMVRDTVTFLMWTMILYCLENHYSPVQFHITEHRRTMNLSSSLQSNTSICKEFASFIGFEPLKGTGKNLTRVVPACSVHYSDQNY